MNPKRKKQLESVTREVCRAIGQWSYEQFGVRDRPEHSELAAAVVQFIEHRLRYPCSGQGLLLDVDGEDRYCNPRVVDWEGVEETLYPIDPKTDEPVDEAVAQFALPLPDAESFPDL